MMASTRGFPALAGYSTPLASLAARGARTWTKRPKKNGRDRAASVPSPMKKTTPAEVETAAANRGAAKKTKKPETTSWKCARGCGACCKLDKGPDFPSPDEIFAHHPDHLQLYKSMIGPDGWCIHYERDTRTCSIYQERPPFCRVEPEMFQEFLGIERRLFNKEACSACIDTITAVYGSESEELKNFNLEIRSTK